MASYNAKAAMATIKKLLELLECSLWLQRRLERMPLHFLSCVAQDMVFIHSCRVLCGFFQFIADAKSTLHYL